MKVVSSPSIASRIEQAFQSASTSTGTDFAYLVKTAERESNFNTTAKARTSSATGLFQFIESTWLETLKQAGPKHGLADYAKDIRQTSSGKYYVANAERRQEILDLRKDPEVASVMAGAFTAKNADYLRDRLGRDPSDGELYIAHFLGANGAARLIETAESKPDVRADQMFGRQAKANRSIFYSGSGKARTVSDVYERLVRKHDNVPSAQYAVAAASQEVAPVPMPKALALATLDAERAPVPFAKSTVESNSFPFPVARLQPHNSDKFAFLTQDTPGTDAALAAVNRVAEPDAADETVGVPRRRPDEPQVLAFQAVQDAGQAASGRLATGISDDVARTTTQASDTAPVSGPEQSTSASEIPVAAESTSVAPASSADVVRAEFARSEPQDAAPDAQPRNGAESRAFAAADPGARIASAWRAAMPSTPFQALFRTDDAASRAPINPSYVNAFAAQPGALDSFGLADDPQGDGTDADTRSRQQEARASATRQASGEGTRGPLNLIGAFRYQLFREPEDILPPV